MPTRLTIMELQRRWDAAATINCDRHVTPATLRDAFRMAMAGLHCTPPPGTDHDDLAGVVLDSLLRNMGQPIGSSITFARKHAYQWAKRRRRDDTNEVDFDYCSDSSPPPYEAIDRRDLIEMIIAKMSMTELRMSQGLADGLTTREVGRRLGCSHTTVQNRMAALRDRLTRQIQGATA